MYNSISLQLSVICVLFHSTSPLLHPSTPCSSVFSYEGSEPEADRWYGEIVISSRDVLVGVRLNIQLDRRLHLMVSWLGDVTTADNKEFTILNLDQRLDPHRPLTTRVMVRFDPSCGSPKVKTILLNGKQICHGEPPIQVNALNINSSKPSSNGLKRPDPIFITDTVYNPSITTYDDYYSEFFNTNQQSGSNSFGTGSNPNNYNGASSSGSSYNPGSSSSNVHTSVSRPQANPVDNYNTKPQTSFVDTYRPEENAESGYAPQSNSGSSYNPNTGYSGSQATVHNGYSTVNSNSRPESNADDDRQQTASVTTTTTATLFERQLSANGNTNSRFSKLPSADRGECGRNSFDSSRRIVGGTSSKEGQWPWLAAIGYKTPGLQNPRNPNWMCGGALITRRYVLTAAHCVSESLLNSQPFVVQLGNIDLKNTTAGVFIEIEDTIMHDFDPKTNFNDIALFRLKKEAPLNRLIQPICLPFEDKQRSDLFLQKSPFVAGWGKIMHDGPLSPTLRHVQVNVVDNPRCKDIFASVGSVIHDISSLCAGEVTGGKDSCAGDSGGPLMLPLKNNKFYVIGVVSYGYRCAEAGFPGVHARVTNYIQWISDNIR